MNLSGIPKVVVEKRQKRLGRGHGSGRGKTSGRGTKGQNARGRLPLTHPHYEGGQRSLFKRLPYRRGKGNAKISKKPLIVNLKALSQMPKNTTVTTESLVKFGIVNKDDAIIFGIKILGDGDIKIPLVIDLPISKNAAQKGEKAGGKVIYKKSNSNFESGSAISNLSTEGKGNINGKP